MKNAPLAPRPATLQVTDAGQPFLAGHGQPAISWSRSDDYLAIGLSANGSIGVDIETWQDRPFGPMLKMICDHEELQRYQMSNVTQTPAHFFRVWTMKEAILKSVGTGFQTDVKRVVLPQSLLSLSAGETLDVVCLGRIFETMIVERDGLTLSIARDTTGLAPA
ncbi:MAG: 4'-phosphopantetheinyl transferase superfamily protein [Hyphomonadaceae bacterium]